MKHLKIRIRELERPLGKKSQEHIHLHGLDSARIVMEQLARWFEDYDENHPHKALKMRSPRKCRGSLFDNVRVSDLMGVIRNDY